MGAVMEFITQGVVPICFPHFGDQGLNAQNLLDRGAALSLISPSKVTPTQKSYESPQFTAEELASKVNQVLVNVDYKENLMTMKCAAMASGGGEKAVQVIEDYYINCLTHDFKAEGAIYETANKDFEDKSRGVSFLKCISAFVLITALVLFVALWGFPGLLHMDKFATHYAANCVEVVDKDTGKVIDYKCG